MDGTWEEGVHQATSSDWLLRVIIMISFQKVTRTGRELSVLSSYTLDISTVDTTVTEFYDKSHEMTPWPAPEVPAYKMQYGCLYFWAYS